VIVSLAEQKLCCHLSVNSFISLIMMGMLIKAAFGVKDFVDEG